MREFSLEVLGREFEGDSPQCGEMSAKLTEGTGARWENPFFKRVSLNGLP